MASILEMLPNEIQQVIYRYALINDPKPLEVSWLDYDWIDLRTSARLLRVSRAVRANMIEAMRIYGRAAYNDSAVTSLVALNDAEEESICAAIDAAYEDMNSSK